MPALLVAEGRGAKQKRFAQVIAFGGDLLRPELERLVKRLSVKELEARYDFADRFARELCGHAGILAFLQPSLAVPFAAALHRAPNQFHELILSTVVFSREPHWREFVSYFLGQIDDGIDCAVTEAIERSRMPIFGAVSKPGKNTNPNAPLMVSFLKSVARQGETIRSRVLAMKWLPAFAASPEQLLEVIDIDSYEDTLVRAMAAMHCLTHAPSHPRIADALRTHLTNLEVDDEDRVRSADPERRAAEIAIVAEQVHRAREKFGDDELVSLSRQRSQSWLEQMVSTKPTNHALVEDGFRRLYAAAGCAPPRAVLWFKSPRAGAVAGTLYARAIDRDWTQFDAFGRFGAVDDYVEGMRRAVRTVPDLTAECDARWQFGRRWRGLVSVADEGFFVGCATMRMRMPPERMPDFGDTIAAFSSDQSVTSAELAEAYARLCAGTDIAKRTTESAITDQVTGVAPCLDAILKRARLEMVGYRALLQEVGVFPSVDDGLDDIVQNCSGFIAFDDWVLVTENAVEIRMDDRRRLHSRDGMCLKYADGWGGYSLDGVRVREQLVLKPETITIDEILAERNVEVRRLMIDSFGLERFLNESGAELVSEDKYGSLYYKEVSWFSGNAILKVRNSTAEPDGSYKDYFLSVPPTLKSAHDAVAWTFGMNASEYDPLVET